MQKKKTLHFTHFHQKNIHISECKNIHKCTIASVTVHICTVIVALAFNILVIFSLSLSLVALTLTSLSIFLIWSTSNHCHQSTHPNTATDQLIRPVPPRSLSDRHLPLISHCLISGFQVGWVMIWLSNWVGFGLNGFLILGWFDLEWFSNLGLVWSRVVHRSGSVDDGGWVW